MEKMLVIIKYVSNRIHNGLAEIPAPIGGPGSDVIDKGLKLQTIGRLICS